MIKDLFANLVGRGWNALLILMVTPFYVHLLGIESFGLIGLYGSLCAICSIVDCGLGETFCKETAKLSSYTKHPLPLTFHTLEILCWGLGAIVCLLFFFLAPYISDKWFLDHSYFSQEYLSFLLRLMAIALLFLLPQIFYSKGLQGLQAHLLNNGILCGGTTLKYGGTLVALYWNPSLESFFYFQIISSMLLTLTLLITTWKKLFFYRVPFAFSIKLFSHFWKFSLHMSAINLTSILLQQIDKIFVSYFFSLQMLGYYSFSYTIASSLYYFIYPIGSYYYPIFIQFIEKKRFQDLKEAYHFSNKLASMVLISLTLLLFIFMKKLIFLWTGDMQLTENCLPLIKIMMLGVLLNCMMSLSFYLQFAFGYTRALLYQNVYSVLLMTPICFVLVHFFGILGIACFYPLVNSGYLLFNRRIAQKQILINHG